MASPIPGFMKRYEAGMDIDTLVELAPAFGVTPSNLNRALSNKRSKLQAAKKRRRQSKKRGR